MSYESLIGLLESVERTCQAGSEVAWRELLEKAAPDDRNELLHAALGIAFEYQGRNLAWLRETLSSQDVFQAADLRQSLIRSLFADQVSSGTTASWSEYGTLGFSAAELALKDRDDPTYLGDTVGGRFQLERRIGSGGFGVVYSAVDLIGGQVVAVKAPQCTTPERTKYAAELIGAEAKFLRTFEQGVPRYIASVATRDELPCLVMEFVEGTPLRAAAESRRFSLEQSLQIVAEIAETLDRFHARGNVHRDLKPENVIIRNDMSACLLDFGISLDEHSQFTNDRRATGTLGYMAPEQLLGLTSQLDGRSDVFALGVVLCELLAGGPVSIPRNKEEWLVQSVGLSTGKLPDSVPERVRAICERSLAREPNDRFDTAGALAREIRAVLAGSDSGPEGPEVSRTHALAAWRMGLTLGGTIENLAFARRHLKLATAASDGGDTKVARRELAAALGFACGATISGEEFVKIALASGFTQGMFEDGEQIRSWFYRQSRIAFDEVGSISATVDRFVAYVEQSYSAVLEVLRQRVLVAARLFEFAMKATIVAFSPDTTEELARLATDAGLGEEHWRPFLDAARQGVAGNSLKLELDRLNKRIERIYLHGDEAARSEG